MSNDDKLIRIEDKIDNIVEKITNIDITLVKQNAVLEDHTRRSLANEKAVEILKEELKPVMIHVAAVSTISKLVVFASVIIGLIASLIKIINYLT